MPSETRISDFGPDQLACYLAGRPFVVSDTESDRRITATREACRAIQVRGWVGVPLVKGGRLLVVLGVEKTTPHAWTDGEVQLLQEAAERTWAASQLARAEAARRESEERLRGFGEASSDVLWIRDAETLEWVYLSPAFETIYGLSREEALFGNTWRNWLDLVDPEDRDRARAGVKKSQHGERVSFEYQIRRPADGEVRLLRNTDFPIRDTDGRVTCIGGVGHDATEEQATSERLKVLVAELQHRTRNLMTVVMGVTRKTCQGSASLADFDRRIQDRLSALGRVNGLLSELNHGDRISFDELLRAELRGHGVTEGEDQHPQVHLSGPRGIRLRSSSVQTLALGLHELATNALKHGALARPEGRLDVSWRMVNGKEGTARLRVDWRESGVTITLNGPDGAVLPRRRGYGLQLLERALPYQLEAETNYELTQDGVRCSITLPLSSTMTGSGRVQESGTE